MKWHLSNPARFEMEKHLLRRHHPGAKIVIENHKVTVFKQLRTSKNHYLIEGQFPPSFPYAPIKVYIRHPVLRKSPPHRYSEKRLCLHGPSDVGPETTAKVYLDWAVQWIRIYERWLKGKPWPDTNISRI